MVFFPVLNARVIVIKNRRIDLRYQYREEHHLFVDNVDVGFGEVQHLKR